MYADHTGSTSCTNCREGHYEPSSGAKLCESLCAVGSSTEVQLSGVGQTGQPACTACATGKYADTVGLAHCSACPVGYHQSSTGSNGCVACAVGTFSNSTGLTNCIACAPGKYAVNVGSAACGERDTPESRDITATVGVAVAMVVLMTLLGFTYYYRHTIFHMRGASGYSVPDAVAKDVSTVVDTEAAAPAIAAESGAVVANRA